ncbi:hypothetical protein GGP72_003216 [Salinibacter ruber]|uniref:Uncharacterized protein n=1 Tax=Salinibacter ruber TaxID=146919 RepID=A0A9X2Q7N7_9BACT|nr:hypothetical protein [Salinibacter ruber]MCS3679240.1 hypothetical protein [Salinibacter ruber]MCS3682554.1 hypothetical protein [Salinibacter ruber]
MIDLSIFAEKDRRRQLISRYWELSSPGNDFAEPMKQIKEDFGLSRGAILGIVRSGSRAVSEIHVCRCGARKEFDSRKDFRSTPTQKPYVCEECKEAHSADGQIAKTADGGASESVPTRSGGETPGGEPPVGDNPLVETQLEDLFGAISSSANVEKRASAAGGKEEKRLRQRLRRLARGLSRASRKLERLSHQLDESRQ